MPQAVDAVLGHFQDAVRVAYGDRLARTVLFGSRARGDHRPDSDYDVAVFLRGYTNLWSELEPLAHIAIDLLLETGALISAKPFRAEAYEGDGPLMRDIRRDGVEL